MPGLMTRGHDLCAAGKCGKMDPDAVVSVALPGDGPRSGLRGRERTGGADGETQGCVAGVGEVEDPPARHEASAPRLPTIRGT